MKKALTTTLIAATAATVFAPAAFAIDYTQVFSGLGGAAGTIEMQIPHNVNYTVTSKFNQPRIVTGTNPHRGVDFGSPYGTDVTAVWNGWVTYADMSLYELDIRLDVNNNGIADDNTFVRYDHLASLASGITVGKYVTKGSVVAKSGNEGGTYQNAPHLHFGMMVDSGNGGRPDYWVRNEPYYRGNATYDYGRRLDFTSLSTFSGNIAALYAYGHDENGKNDVVQGDVVIFHRKSGTATWTAATATKSGDKFSYNFTGVYPAGTSIQWMARAVRTSIKTQISYHWAFHNPKFNQPDFNPNATAYAYDYFTNTVQ